MSNRALIALSVLLLAGLLIWISGGRELTPQQAREEGISGLLAVDCWFGQHQWLGEIDCYSMQVPENHDDPQSRVISFPVVIYRAAETPNRNAPVLHLGGGGPGAPMYLDSVDSISYILYTHDQLSLSSGRDLIAIDPRGSGLSEPLLSCQTFVDNEIQRMGQNLTPEQEFESASQDYLGCIEDFASRGTDYRQYNSLSVIRDIELLRSALGIEQWVLIGVSYASIYAQLAAHYYPRGVEALILDSATFLQSKAEQDHIEQTLAPFRAILDYCRFSSRCERTPADFEDRFWRLHQQLNRKPIEFQLSHPYENRRFDFVLNGERMLAAMIEGTYGVTLFDDLPRIVEDLENRRQHSLLPYLESVVGYYLDRSYGDIASDAHHCFETRPYIDREALAARVRQLAPGYFRDMLTRSLAWGDYCDELGITGGKAEMLEAFTVAQPTLFLHGERDTITPLADVKKQQPRFDRGLLLPFPVSHSVLTSDECAERLAARFLDNPELPAAALACD